MAYASTIPTTDLKRLMVGCFRDLAVEHRGGFVPTTSRPDWERDHQEAIAQQVIDHLDDEIETAKFSARTQHFARETLASDGRSFDALDPGARLAVCEAAARAQREAARYIQFRVNERLLKYSVQDPFLRGTFIPTLPTATQSGTGSAANLIGPTSEELVTAYMLEKKPTWVAKTHGTVRRCLSYLIEFVGADSAGGSITSVQIGEFSQAICRLRANHHTGPSKTFSGRQTDVVEHRISPKTASIIFGHCAGLFRWMAKKHYIAINPATGNAPVPPKIKKGQKPRLPFSEADLTSIFTSPIYRGSLSRDRRYEPGDLVLSDAKYWVPVLGYYTGARLGELIQLRFSDVAQAEGIWFIDLNEDDAGGAGAGEAKHIKSEAGVRRVPLHPDLITMGFLEFVRHRAKQRSAKGRLFYDVEYGADGMASSRFSKWFGRSMDKVGLTDKRLVFHSFRHTMEDALRNASLPPYVIDRLIGHTEGKSSGEYGEGAELSVLYEAVRSAKMKVNLAALLANHRPPML